ncbi:uncharacterized protein Z519_06762 [Cladophialophora bantiana CBS 173.52]|uniref:Myb-like domain-containing protein n=1 Tax=Cladophialophora bantiana (strain ATCC 10958 / CBS 173.52 / CDC B-1940 / NIH 8579) TaxID=1442370 RepID=A0A0D2HI32_CLAB1|nr:uncharacterized protein Z519_06762 [Cladophialophora bantiana CBS 173.52]KIW92913.1 hypothetical protein Z519_06762 [Cladophialophora bantiana CBS 173.52]
MPFKWDAASERNLLLFAIAEMSPPATSIWPRVAEKLGNDLNASACSQKFYKLKKESEKLLHQGDSTVGGDAATPFKDAKTAKTPASKGTSGRKRNVADVNGEEPKTPTKRKRNMKNVAPAEPEIKGEVEEEKIPAVKSEDEVSKGE